MPGTVDGKFTASFWVPIVGPLIGGVIGVLLYDLFIGDVLHSRGIGNEPPGPAVEEPLPIAGERPLPTAEDVAAARRTTG